MSPVSPDTGPREPPRLWRRWGVNAALLLAVAGLAAFYLAHRTQQRADTGPPLTALATEQVARVRIERPGQPATVLEKHADDSRDGGRSGPSRPSRGTTPSLDGGGTTPGTAEVGQRREQLPRALSGTGADDWRLTAPFAARANRFAVENLLRVAQARRALTLDNAGDLRQYGLVTPQARLRLDEETIEFGALHPFQQQVYVRYRGAVSLIAASALGAVLRPPGHFVDGRLFEPGSQLVALQLPGFRLALEDGRWQRRPPDKGLTSDQLGDFVAHWTHAQALSVGPAGKRPALAAIRLTRTRPGIAPETIAFDVLAYKPTFVLRRRDEQLEYRFPEEIGKQLLEIAVK